LSQPTSERGGSNRKRQQSELLPVDDMSVRADAATAFLKALAHEGRLMILCHLVSGERSVTELEQLLGSRQAAVSQQLARLRSDGLVQCRRDGRAILYSIGDTKVSRTVSLMYQLFCATE
jgi:DNA-binding transcriptional ArsR family regulator